MCVDVSRCEHIHLGVVNRPGSDPLWVSLVVGLWVGFAVRGYVNLGWRVSKTRCGEL